MNMSYFWKGEKQNDKIIDVSCHPGKKILGDYVTKRHPAILHQQRQPNYVHMANSPYYLQRSMTPKILRGCVKTCPRSFLGKPFLPGKLF